jgi:hypothetical protein
LVWHLTLAAIHDAAAVRSAAPHAVIASVTAHPRAGGRPTATRRPEAIYPRRD